MDPFFWNPAIDHPWSRYCFYQYRVHQPDQGTWNYSTTSYSLFMVKLKHRTNTLLDTGKFFIMLPEITGLQWHRSLRSPTTPMSITRLKKPHMKLSSGLNRRFLCPSSWDLIRNKHQLCCSNICRDLPPHSHCENSVKNAFMDNLLQPQLYQALLERERTSKQIFSSTFERCREQTTRSHAYRDRFKLRHHLAINRKYFAKITNKTSHEAKNFNSKDLDLLPLPDVSRIPPIEFKTTETLRLRKLFIEITLSNTIIKKHLYPQW